MRTFSVSFQYVNPQAHPEYYCKDHGTHPMVSAAKIPDEHWREMRVPHDTHVEAVQHVRGLKQLIREGELVRNVHKQPMVDGRPEPG